MPLRSYQETAINKIFQFYSMTKGVGNPLIDMCVGSGKSHVIAHLIEEIIKRHPSEKILMLVHVKELIEQNYQKIEDLKPPFKVGINAASLNRKDYDKQVIYCSIQTVYKHADKFGIVNTILIDECHLISKDQEKGMYGKFIKRLKLFNPKLKVIGFTGTPYRMKGGPLVEGEGRLFSNLVYSYTIKQALEKGYLVPLVVPDKISKVKSITLEKKFGEFTTKSIEELVNRSTLIEKTVTEIIVLSKDRKHKLIFCSSIDHAENVQKEFKYRGIEVGALTSKTSKLDRRWLIKDFKAGRLEYLLNVGVLTTGFDFPALDCGILLRHTASVGLFVQITGRFLRPSPETNKVNALWLDFTDSTERLGPLDDIVPPPPPKPKSNREQEELIKLCENCGEICYPATRICPGCGEEFSFKSENHSSKVSLADILSQRIPLKNLEVTAVSYSKHLKPGNPPTFKVTYSCGLSNYSEYIAFESGSKYANIKARAWWKERTRVKFPSSVDEALKSKGDLLSPSDITVDFNPKYPRIMKQNLQ